MFCAKCGKSLTPDAFFCGYCGEKNRNKDDALVDVAESSRNSIEPVDELIEFASQVPSEISGTLSNQVSGRFCEIVKTRKFDKVLVYILISRRTIIVAPHSKERGSFGVVGLVLTGGAGLVGVLGMAAGDALAKIISNKQNKEIQNILEKIRDKLIFDASSVRIRAYEYRFSWDLVQGSQWETRVSIEGDAIFNEKSGDFGIKFAFPGKTYERTRFTKPNNKVPELASVLGVSVPEIIESKKFIW